MSQIDQSIVFSATAMIGVQILSVYTSVPVYIQMILLSSLTIYIGSRYSLRPLNEAARHAARNLLSGSAGIDHKSMNNVETLETRDAYMFPIIGGIVLTSLFLIFKFVPKSIIHIVVQCYFGVIGTGVLTGKLAQFIRYTLSTDTLSQLDNIKQTVPNPIYYLDHYVQRIVDRYNNKSNNSTSVDTTTSTSESSGVETRSQSKHKHSHKLGDKSIEINEQPTSDITLITFVSLICSSITFYYYTTTNYFLLNNVFALCFAVQGIELLSLGSTKNGYILLCGLFVYDIFFVFGTTIMVSVAKNFDAPIKLLFPILQSSLVDNVSVNKIHYSMLGLGDIVIPGIYCALMLRFDCDNYLKLNKSIESSNYLSLTQKLYNLPYFTTSMIFYIGGLIITIFVMYMFDAAQPALLYLVPALLISTSGLALIRSQFSIFFNYTEESADSNNEEESKKL